jgi:hypothetical protein
LCIHEATSSLRFGHEGGPAVLRVENSGAGSLAALNLGNNARNWQLRVEGTDGNKFKIFDATAIADRLTIDTLGLVGIGTTRPMYGRLMIEDGAVPLSLRESGQSFTAGGLWRMPLDAGMLRFDVNTAATGDFTSYVTPLTMHPTGDVGIHRNLTVGGDVMLSGADCAEDFDVASAGAEVEPGTVMVIDQEGALKPSEQPYDKRVAGVVSGGRDYRPGLILDRQEESEENRMPVALMGKVACKVEARESSIEVGDLLTTASTPGYAMKATDPTKASGAVIGKALQRLTKGRGLIGVLVSLQ